MYSYVYVDMCSEMVVKLCTKLKMLSLCEHSTFHIQTCWFICTHINFYVYIYMCMCACVCIRIRMALFYNHLHTLIHPKLFHNAISSESHTNMSLTHDYYFTCHFILHFSCCCYCCCTYKKTWTLKTSSYEYVIG